MRRWTARSATRAIASRSISTSVPPPTSVWMPAPSRTTRPRISPGQAQGAVRRELVDLLAAHDDLGTEQAARPQEEGLHLVAPGVEDGALDGPRVAPVGHPDPRVEVNAHADPHRQMRFQAGTVMSTVLSGLRHVDA